jgi:hypothetical protein
MATGQMTIVCGEYQNVRLCVVFSLGVVEATLTITRSLMMVCDVGNVLSMRYGLLCGLFCEGSFRLAVGKRLLLAIRRSHHRFP